ncbi:MAG: radical SAM family heme chaperone HemW [Thermosynechococcaceae cyanobacterium]
MTEGLVSGLTASDPLDIGDVLTAAYVHIPFCRRRCFYCDFPISVVGDRLRGETSRSIQTYVEDLCREIRATPSLGQPLSSIFFGGGTPSLLSGPQVWQILDTLTQQFGVADNPEISMEMDPATFDLAHISAYRQAGVNRVSLGVQAFQDELLQACGRTHCRADIKVAIALIRDANIENWSLDLIAGLPHQTLTQWQTTLAEAIALGPQHISAYDLVLEPGTVFGKRFDPGEAPLPNDELTAQMYRIASTTLQGAGYDHYEISNYAQSGYACRHNQVYWRNGSYYGFGMGATSYVQGKRFSRPRTRDAYGQWLATYLETGCIDAPIASAADRLFETFMLGLRRLQGVNLQPLGLWGSSTIATTFRQHLDPYCTAGWVQFSPDGTMSLTDPEGFLFSNQVLVTVWQALTEPQPATVQAELRF